MVLPNLTGDARITEGLMYMRARAWVWETLQIGDGTEVMGYISARWPRAGHSSPYPVWPVLEGYLDECRQT